MKKADGLNIALGNTVKVLRNNKGLTQEELAERCDTSAVYISEIERGIKQPTFRTVYIISKALDLKLHQFVKKVESNLTNED
ncbi:MAG: helix-turn-helix transcriptional regulator [Gracilimonas sp.]|uniref:helix-turn-helix domain-containing protein n=1 Tax=Gracilimonas sp. TaxID=1974203 RepID=UPI0019BD4D01|nr:helix-turn-helix transcriptional regulator [Gracilimonas sp.]MBD3615363.1 helix-turn-helix transcriptional regulator [Gracilimonas sp.]